MVAERNQKNAAMNAQMAEPICDHVTKLMLFTSLSPIWCHHSTTYHDQGDQAGQDGTMHRCDGSSIVAGLIDPDKSDLGFSDRQSGAMSKITFGLSCLALPIGVDVAASWSAASRACERTGLIIVGRLKIQMT